MDRRTPSMSSCATGRRTTRRPRTCIEYETRYDANDERHRPADGCRADADRDRRSRAARELRDRVSAKRRRLGVLIGFDRSGLSSDDCGSHCPAVAGRASAVRARPSGGRHRPSFLLGERESDDGRATPRDRSAHRTHKRAASSRPRLAARQFTRTSRFVVPPNLAVRLDLASTILIPSGVLPVRTPCVLLLVSLSAATARAQQPAMPEHQHTMQPSDTTWTWSTDASVFFGFNAQDRKFTDFTEWESENWIMLAGQRALGPGRFSFDAM